MGVEEPSQQRGAADTALQEESEVSQEQLPIIQKQSAFGALFLSHMNQCLGLSFVFLNSPKKRDERTERKRSILDHKEMQPAGEKPRHSGLRGLPSARLRRAPSCKVGSFKPRPVGRPSCVGPRCACTRLQRGGVELPHPSRPHRSSPGSLLRCSCCPYPGDAAAPAASTAEAQSSLPGTCGTQTLF